MPAPRIRAAAICAWALCAGITAAQMGTPPQFFCGKSYVLSGATVNANVVADEPSSILVDTLHYVDRISLASRCPPTSNPSLRLSVRLLCTADPSSGPTEFGPFSLTEGFTQIPITVPVPAGQVRECDCEIAGRLTFNDGSILEQIAHVPLSVLAESPTRPGEPRVDVRLLDDRIKRVHPGDSRVLTFRITNNTDHAVIGTYSASLFNTADMPTLLGGDNDGHSGVFALADPGGGDAFPVVDHAPANPLGCIELPARPHDFLSVFGEVPLPILESGQSTDVDLDVRTYPLSPSGVMSTGRFNFRTIAFGPRTLDDVAVASFTLAADRAQVPAFACSTSSGRSASAFLNSDPDLGFVVRLQGDLSVAGNEPFDVNFAVDHANIQMRVNGEPIASGNSGFSGYLNSEGQWGRLNAEVASINPLITPGYLIEMNVPYILRVHPASAATTQVAINGFSAVPGAPNDFESLYPVFRGSLDIERTGNLVDGSLDFIGQFSAFGVENNSFILAPHVALGPVFYQVVAPDRVIVTSYWFANDPHETPYWRFHLFSDIRAFAEPESPCIPGDMNRDGLVDFLDIDPFTAAVVEAASGGPSDPCADINQDGQVNNEDIDPFVTLLTSAC